MNVPAASTLLHQGGRLVSRSCAEFGKHRDFSGWEGGRWKGAERGRGEHSCGWDGLGRVVELGYSHQAASKPPSPGCMVPIWATVACSDLRLLNFLIVQIRDIQPVVKNGIFYIDPKSTA